jgi:hypothetical protein
MSTKKAKQKKAKAVLQRERFLDFVEKTSKVLLEVISKELQPLMKSGETSYEFILEGKEMLSETKRIWDTVRDTETKIEILTALTCSARTAGVVCDIGKYPLRLVIEWELPKTEEKQISVDYTQ